MDRRRGISQRRCFSDLDASDYWFSRGSPQEPAAFRSLDPFFRFCHRPRGLSRPVLSTLRTSMRSAFGVEMFESKPLEFLKGTLRNPAAVGSVIPSSTYLAREYTRGIDFDEETVVVELGPGTGPITEQFHDVMPDPANYVGVEQDGDYVDILEERFPRMHFVQGSAEETVDYLDDLGFEAEDVDVVASVLPFATLPQAVQARIYDQLERMMTSGTIFRAVQLAHAYPVENSRRFRRRMTRKFGPFTRSRLVWRNVPPAFVLTWEQ